MSESLKTLETASSKCVLHLLPFMQQALVHAGRVMSQVVGVFELFDGSVRIGENNP